MVGERPFQIKLPGLVQLLAQNLYAEPDVFLREMIQNAHDSIRRRAVIAQEQGDSEPPPPRIRITLDRAQREIRIDDNGAGLTGSEIDEFLSTIGSSGTDELRRRIIAGDHARTVELIGQFGIGFLSAFIVADTVTMVTKASNHDALVWESHGGQGYTVTPGQRDHSGATVTLHLRPEHTRYLDSGLLKRIIRAYADFIGIPVYVNDDQDPANAVTAPWHRSFSTPEERRSAHADFWVRKFADDIPLHVFAIDEAFQQSGTSRPGGSEVGQVRGVLAITERRSPYAGARGTVDIYVNRMFVAAANRDVLPPWAKFLQGVVECNELTPNAARDNVVRNAALADVQQVLGEIIVRELADLSRSDRRRFIEIMRWHSYDLLSMSLQPEHESFFYAVADMIPLESDQGPITVADYLGSAATNGSSAHIAYYITERSSLNQYLLLSKAKGIRVFTCDEPLAEQFLKRYAKTWPDRLQLKRLDAAGAETIFEAVPADEAAKFADLEQAYALIFTDHSVVAKADRFQPAELPAVLTESRDNQNRMKMIEIAEDVVLPTSIRKIVSGFLDEQREPLTLHLNTRNPTIRRLTDRPTLRDEVSRHALIALYNNALMLSARTQPAGAVGGLFEQYNQVIELMLAMAEEKVRLEGEIEAGRTELSALRGGDQLKQDPYVSCFVAMPFGDARATEIYKQICGVLEDQPYYWRVVRADDDVERPGLWSNLKAKLLRAHFFIAILTEKMNPNVMIEIGRMEALERALLVLRDQAAPPPPADLQGLLYEDLRETGPGLRSEVAEALSRQQVVQTLRGQDRYLSVTVLVRAGLHDTAAREISRRHPTWRGFLAADPQAIANQVGITRYMVEGVQQAIATWENPEI